MLWHILVCLFGFVLFWAYLLPLCWVLVEFGFEGFIGPLFDWSIEIDDPWALIAGPIAITCAVGVIFVFALVLTGCLILEGLLITYIW